MMNNALMVFAATLILAISLDTPAIGESAASASEAKMAENWPAWRGLRGDGTSLETGVPTEWSATRNLLWKTALPGVGHSSPIVWGDRVFVTTAIPEKLERVLLCLDRRTGRILWRQTVLTAPLEAKQVENSYASGTPATDGRRVYVAFLEINRIVVASYDFRGNRVWLVRAGEFQNDHGFSSSPVLYQDKVILSGQGKRGNFLFALNCNDGNTIWKKPLENPSNSFGQPLVCNLAGRPQIILCGDKAVTSFDPNDGARIWFVENASTDSVITPVFNEQAGLLLTSTSWPKKELLAIKPNGQGNVTQTKTAWRSQAGAPYVPSPIAVGSYFLTIAESRNEIHCFDAASGKVVWHEPLGHAHASPVTAGGLVYFLNDNGEMSIVKAGEKFELVARNSLGEKCFASPAISGGQLFIRSHQNLFCIGRVENGRMGP